jgi:hypothetical protein
MAGMTEGQRLDRIEEMISGAQAALEATVATLQRELAKLTEGQPGYILAAAKAKAKRVKMPELEVGGTRKRARKQDLPREAAA